MNNYTKNEASSPFYCFESVLDRFSKTNLRLWILNVILIVLLVGSNALWIWYESQFEDVVTTQEVDQDIETDDNDGDLTITGIGNIYGEDKTESQNDQ